LFDRVAFEIFGRAVHWYGIIIVISIIAATIVAMRNAKTLGYNPEIVLDICLVVIPVAVVMSRLYYVVFSLGSYMDRPLDVFKIWEGGLTIHGAIGGGVLAVWFYTQYKKLNFKEFADIAAPGIILAQAIGRWGNFFNQEAYGLAVVNPVWQWFPFAVFIESNQQWHLATFFYESVMNLSIFIFLTIYFMKRKFKGEIFIYYMVAYSAGRFLLESLRLDSLFIGPFRTAQIVSVLLILIGVGFIYKLRRNNVKIKN